MDAATIIAALRAKGVRVYLVAGRPQLEGEHLLTPDDWQALKAHAAGLVAALLAEQSLSSNAPPWLYRELTISGVRCVVYGEVGELGDNVRLARRCPPALSNRDEHTNDWRMTPNGRQEDVT